MLRGTLSVHFSTHTSGFLWQSRQAEDQQHTAGRSFLNPGRTSARRWLIFGAIFLSVLLCPPHVLSCFFLHRAPLFRQGANDALRLTEKKGLRSWVCRALVDFKRCFAIVLRAPASGAASASALRSRVG